jgi:hypothetical protein
MATAADQPEGAAGRTPADPARLFAVLADHEVDFLVAGGVAVYVHGYPRLTQDLDIVPAPGIRNLRKLAAALRELGARALDSRGRARRLDLSDPAGLAVGDYFLVTDAGALDLVNGERPNLKRYRRLKERAIGAEIGGVAVRVIGKDDLISMKRVAGREKDLRDIAALTALEREERSR